MPGKGPASGSMPAGFTPGRTCALVRISSAGTRQTRESGLSGFRGLPSGRSYPGSRHGAKADPPSKRPCQAKPGQARQQGGRPRRRAAGGAESPGAPVGRGGLPLLPHMPDRRIAPRPRFGLHKTTIPPLPALNGAQRCCLPGFSCCFM